MDLIMKFVLVVGGWGNTRQVIRKTIESDEIFEKVQLKDLISDERQTRIMIQMTNGDILIRLTIQCIIKIHFLSIHRWFNRSFRW